MTQKSTAVEGRESFREVWGLTLNTPNVKRSPAKKIRSPLINNGSVIVGGLPPFFFKPWGGGGGVVLWQTGLDSES